MISSHERAEMQRVWELHRATPPPLGFDPEPHYRSIDHHYFGLLRILPWRIELGNLYGEPAIWRDPDASGSATIDTP